MHEARASVDAGWRQPALRALSVFVVGWLVAWIYKQVLLEWIAGPLVRSWDASPCSQQHSHYNWYETRSPDYRYAVSMAAFLLALPFIARLVLVLSNRHTPTHQKTSSASFLLFSYLAVALSLVSAQQLLLPAVADRLLRSEVWCSAGELDKVNSYVLVAVNAFLSLALVVQSVLVLALSRSRRASSAH